MILTVLVLAPLCFGQQCQEQVWMNPAEVPFVVDPNAIPATEAKR